MGKFLKGHKTNIGRKHKPYNYSEEGKKRMRLHLLGKKWTPEVREKMKNRIPWNKGKKGVQKHSEEFKQNLRERMTGNQYTKGNKLTDEHRRKCSEALKGDKHPNWKGGVNPINDTIRKSFEYKLWRESVFKRDSYTCIWCGQVGGKLQADHIKPFCNYPELRFAIDNGRTLCKECHSKTETYCSRARHF